MIMQVVVLYNLSLAVRVVILLAPCMEQILINLTGLQTVGDTTIAVFDDLTAGFLKDVGSLTGLFKGSVVAFKY